MIHKVGQQALATFVAGAYLARLTPIVFHAWGKGPLVVAGINLLGFAALIATAYAVGWFRAERAAAATRRVPHAVAPAPPANAADPVEVRPRFRA